MRACSVIGTITIVFSDRHHHDRAWCCGNHPAGGAFDDAPKCFLHLRRRRQGPFAPGAAEEPADEAARLKALGALARAGFPRDVAERALDLSPEEATERLLAARRD